jgi:hypothetical protein
LKIEEIELRKSIFKMDCDRIFDSFNQASVDLFQDYVVWVGWEINDLQKLGDIETKEG